MRATRTSYLERASKTGSFVPSDIELRDYLISLEILGIDERADINAIRHVFQQMIFEIRNADVGINTGGAEEGEE